MFTRLVKSLVSLKSLPRPCFSFSSITPLQHLANYFSEGLEKLPNPASLPEALQSFSKLKSLSEELYPTKPMQQAFWCSQVCSVLASNGHLEESRQYYEEAKTLLSKVAQASAKPAQASGSIQAAQTYKNLVQIAVIYKDYIEAESFYSQALHYVQAFDSLAHAGLLENMIVPKLMLGKPDEALEIIERILDLIKEVPNNENLKNEVLIKQAECYMSLMQLDVAKEITEGIIERTKEKFDKHSLLMHITACEVLCETYAMQGLMSEAVSSALLGGNMLNREFGAEKAILYYKGILIKLRSHPASGEIVEQMVKLLESVDESNSSVLEAYKMISGFYFNVGNLEESVNFTEKSIKIIKEMNNFHELIEAYFNAAMIYFDYDIEKAKEYVDLANGMHQMEPNKNYEMYLKYLMFNYYLRVSEFDMAEKEIDFCIDNTPESPEMFPELVNYHIDKSKMFYITQKFEKCIESDLKVVKLLEEYEDIKTDRVIGSFGRIGASHARLGNYEKALEYLFKAVDFITDNFPQNKADYLFIYVTLINTYSLMNQFSIALEHAHEILPGVEASSNMDAMTISFYFEIGNIYEKIMNKQKAKEFYLKAKEILVKVSEHELLELVQERLDNLDN